MPSGVHMVLLLPGSRQGIVFIMLGEMGEGGGLHLPAIHLLLNELSIFGMGANWAGMPVSTVQCLG